jgi:hypothetical protein
MAYLLERVHHQPPTYPVTSARRNQAQAATATKLPVENFHLVAVPFVRRLGGTYQMHLQPH